MIDVQNEIRIRTNRYEYAAYEAMHGGQRFGYIDVYDRTGQPVRHFVRRRRKTQDELRAFAERFEQRGEKT